MQEFRKERGISRRQHTGLCKCGKPRELSTKRYCRQCGNAYNREWRKKHSLTPEQRIKANIRAKVKMKVRRGLMKSYPCEVCGEEKVEAHHDDYSKPYDVRWLCFKHHRLHHKQERARKHEQNPKGS
jgi:hypothetical protein